MMKLNNKGFSLTEVMIAVGVAGMLGVGTSSLITKQTDANKELRQRQIIRSTTREIQSMIGKKEICELNTVLRANSGNNPQIAFPNGYTRLKNLGEGVRIMNISSQVIGNANNNKSIAEITIEFQRRLLVRTETVTRVISTGVVINEGVLECAGYEKDSIFLTSMRKSCVAIGGDWSDVDEDCTITSGSFENSELQTRLEEILCETLGATRNAGRCDQVNVSGFITSQNLTENQICLNNGSNCRTEFDSSSCNGNQFLTRSNISGESTCTAVQVPF